MTPTPSWHTCCSFHLLLLLVAGTSSQLTPATTFGLRLAATLGQRTATTEGGQLGPNLVFSPVSAHAALCMLALGARGGSLAELEQLLGLPAANSSQLHRQLMAELAGAAAAEEAVSSSASRPELRMANLLALATGFTPNPKFRQLLETYFRTKVEHLNFAGQPAKSIQHINKYVSQATGGQIDRLLTPKAVDAATRLILINALYFKALWAEPFDPRQTKVGIFTTAAGQQVSVPFMRRTVTAWLRQDPVRQVTVLELPYNDGATSMLVVLPFRNSSSNSSILDHLLPVTVGGDGGLGLENLRGADGRAARIQVAVELPRFKIRYRTDLTQVLPTLGVQAIFDPSRADLRGIADVGTPRLYVNLALQEAVVEVTEEGTRAAAATVIGLRAASAPFSSPPYLFRADRPFGFVIYNRKAGVTLFAGKVRDPSAA
jgi:serpin B